MGDLKSITRKNTECISGLRNLWEKKDYDESE